MAERFEVECPVVNCENHDDLGCMKVYVELDSDGRCIYLRLVDNQAPEEDTDETDEWLTNAAETWRKQTQ